MRHIWDWLKTELRWIFGASEMSLQGLEYDEESGELRPKS
jgi:hypothetical protein